MIYPRHNDQNVIFGLSQGCYKHISIFFSLNIFKDSTIPLLNKTVFLSIPRQISICSICRLASIYLATFLRPFNKQLFAMNKLAGLGDPSRRPRPTDADQFKRSNNI